MYRKEEFRFPSRDGHTQLYAVRWIPQGNIQGLVHLCHGLNGYMGLFDDFAVRLAEEGFLVFGHDYLGHGRSAEYAEDLGFFSQSRGDDYVLADILMLTRLMQESYPEKPMILLGQSMGSYFVRRFLFTWPDEVDGAIILATNGMRMWRVRLNQVFLKLSGVLRKERYRPSRAHRLALRMLNRGKRPHQSPYDWLSRNAEVGIKRADDPYASHVPTLRLFQDLNHTMSVLAKEEFVLDMAKDLPILILCGEEDPFGKYGEEARRLASLFKQGGLRYVSLKAYPEDRHDLLHEVNHAEVEEDILTWLEACLYLIEQKSS